MNFFKSFKIDKDYYEKKPNINKKNIFITFLENLTRASRLAVGTSLSIRGVGASIGVPIAGCVSFIASVATLITNEDFSKVKLRYKKLEDWMNMVSIVYEKTLSKCKIDKKIIEKRERN